MEKQEKYVSTHDMFPLVKELLADHRQAVFRISGSSMLPFLGGRRDSVYLEECDRKHLKKGDIILFQKAEPPQDYILHRVHRVLEDGYLPWGDGNLVPDAPIRPEQVIGCVTKVDRKGTLISCDNPGWIIASTVWRGLSPFRGILLGCYRMAGRLKQRGGENG